MLIKTSELEGDALDWAVDKAIGSTEGRVNEYSTIWDFGGPLIEQFNVVIFPVNNGNEWGAEVRNNDHFWIDTTIGDCDAKGSTPLIASMRAIVAAKLGESIDIQQEWI